MTQEHPITPPPELVEQWYEAINNSSTSWKQELATQAARWGADQELEACCEWVDSFQDKFVHAHDLRLVRRLKLPNLKKQALAALSRLSSGALCTNPVTDKEIIRRALESLPE